MDRLAKKNLVTSLQENMQSASCVIVLQNQGLTVGDMDVFRNSVRKNESSFRIVKNTLAKIALEGTDYEYLSSSIKGPVGLAYSNNPVQLAKSVAEFAEDNDKISIVCGAMGKVEMSKGEIIQLSKLPSLDELRAKIISLINSPASSIAAVSSAVPAGLVRVINQKYSN